MTERTLAAPELSVTASDKTIANDTALLSLMMIAAFHGMAVDEAQLRHEFGHARFNTQTLLLAARFLGLSAKSIQQPASRLDNAPLPAIAVDRAGQYFILAKYQSVTGASAKLLIQRPGDPPALLSLDDFLAQWSGELILVTSRHSLAGELAHFDFSWVIPAIVRYRKLLGEILLISFVLQLIGLVTPLFFQVVMDKVLVNHAMKTLDVIAVGLVLAILFEVTLSNVRTWVFAHTSSKIDVELGARLFRHLLSLPLSYFQSRRVGDSVARIRELENIRSFLTSNAVTLVLDVMFSFIFLAVMFWYSVWLSLIVVASIPLYIGLSVAFTPLIRARLADKFNKGAENQ